MNTEDTQALILELQRTTAFARIGLAELRTAFARIVELGYTITPPARPGKQ
jgi:hypothetical protein